MSAIARYFMHEGAKVAGYDRTPSPLTAELEKEGGTNCTTLLIFRALP